MFLFGVGGTNREGLVLAVALSLFYL